MVGDVNASRWESSDVPRGSDYDERFDALARSGRDVHGEASFVMGYQPRSVLDAGCGTGRVAIELARRGVDVIGVDVDPEMLAAARLKDSGVEFLKADLSDFTLVTADGTPKMFDFIVAAGNVMIFLRPGTETTAVTKMAAHLSPSGVLVSGFQLLADRYSLVAYDDACAAAGLELAERFSTWTRDPWSVDSGYVVSIHRAAAASGLGVDG
jgi:SAM-dependent methyltransferase